MVSRVGQRWAGQVVCFTTPARQLTCTLLARWETGYRDPWVILTDLPPTAVDVAGYGLRAWLECGFKDSKRGGWHWEQTKMDLREGTCDQTSFRGFVGCQFCRL